VKDNIAASLTDAVWVLAASAAVLAAAAAFVILAAGYWTGHLAGWAARRIRHRRDVRRMRRRPAPTTAPSEQAVLDYLTIRTTWRQPTREEIKR
jgi:hypothetical protein